MKKLFAAVLCSLMLLSACSAEIPGTSSESQPENSSSLSSGSSSEESLSSEVSLPEESSSSEESDVPLPELIETENLPENKSFTKVEISCFYTLNCYALTDSGNLYRYDYTDESMECIRSGVVDFWAGSFYDEGSHYGGPNIVFENGWIFYAGEYYYKPDFITVAGDFFLEKDGDIGYLDNGEWKTLAADAKIIKAQEPGYIRYLDSENNLFNFSKYIGEPVLLAENVVDYDWNFFDKINYADETIYITENGKIEIIFDEEFSKSEVFLSHIPETAEKVYTSSGNFLFQKADGTYFYGHKSVDRSRDINITGIFADIHFRDYAIIGTDGNIYLHIEELTYFGEAIDDNYTVIRDFVIELP